MKNEKELRLKWNESKLGRILNRAENRFLDLEETINNRGYMSSAERLELRKSYNKVVRIIENCNVCSHAYQDTREYLNHVDNFLKNYETRDDLINEANKKNLN
jgi:hypothetical protein